MNLHLTIDISTHISDRPLMFNSQRKVLSSPPSLSSSSFHLICSVAQAQNLGVSLTPSPHSPISNRRNCVSDLLLEYNSKSTHFSLSPLPTSIAIPIQSADILTRVIILKHKPGLVASHGIKTKFIVEIIAFEVLYSFDVIR